MKPTPFSTAARASVGVLLSIIGISLFVLALNANLTEGRVRQASNAAPVTPTAVAPSAPAATCPAIAFSRNTIVDFSATSGEPFINSAPVQIAPNTPAGSPFISVPFGVSTSISILWKSIDAGRTFIQLGSPITRDAATAPGGGDTHQDFDALGRFYYSDLAAACVTTAVSDDGGNTFPKVNPLACVGVGDPGGLTDDRQWSSAFGDGRGYMTTRNLAVSGPGGNFHLARTRDAGVTWNSFNQPIGTVSQSGPLVMDKTKRNIGGTNYILGYQIYHTNSTALKLLRIRDDDTGAATVAVDNLPIITPGGSVATVFPVMAVGRDGSLYVTWSNGTAIQMVTSQDFGQTWSAAKVVSGPAAPAAKIMPWVIAGDTGRANVVWYQSTEGTGNALTNRWDIYMAQTVNGLEAAPAFETTKVSEHTIHFGEICLRGLNCDLPISPGDRSFLEFPSITLDHRGAAMITWNDNTNQSGLLPGGDPVSGAPYVMFAKQVRGPSLFASVGSVDQAAGTVSITQPTNGQEVTTAPLNVAGTHTLPPATFDNDEAGDAKFPDHGPVIGANVPALDIRKVTVTDTATAIIVKIEVAADLTPTAMQTAATTTGGDGLLYLAQWDYDESSADPIDRVFWVAAEVRGGVPVARTGTLGVIRSSTSKKFITYNPVLDDSLQATAVITNGPQSTITLTIPRTLVGSPPNGALLKTVTGYAMSQRGALTPCPENTQAACEGTFSPTSLPLKVDASGAFNYVVGGGAQFDGVVEYSLDDPTFANPQPATADSASNSWQAQLGPTELTPGAHTLYARQTIHCNVSSQIASVSFTVPGGLTPIRVSSRKMHGSQPFSVELFPIVTSPGIECRRNGTGEDHQVVFKFSAPVTSSAASVIPEPGKTAETDGPPVRSADGTELAVNLKNVTNAQTLTVGLVGVSDGTNTNNVAVPMAVLWGDVNESRRVDSGDVTVVRQQNLQPLTDTTFRSDVNASGRTDSGDVTVTRKQNLTGLPAQ